MNTLVLQARFLCRLRNSIQLALLIATLHIIPISVRAEVETENCARPPRFAAQRGISRSLVSTSERFQSGLVLFPLNQDGSRREALQLPSWTSAGRLGPFVATERGDIFVAPVPNVNTLSNPPERQNWIYRVDTDTGELKPFVEIPVEIIPSQQNPYGILGLA